ncbi:hypothetical protein SDC9_179122 [bioreactor metagenome]|uniref:Uncharacterized protein n=1 Tax=bioreactor metagenome TaxID=1076179 RepID=A0A645GY40_9ZZZZ
MTAEAELFQRTDAVRALGPFARLVERRQQHRGEDGDDRDHNQQFNEREIPSVREMFHNRSFPSADFLFPGIIEGDAEFL